MGIKKGVMITEVQNRCHNIKALGIQLESSRNKNSVFFIFHSFTINMFTIYFYNFENLFSDNYRATSIKYKVLF